MDFNPEKKSLIQLQKPPKCGEQDEFDGGLTRYRSFMSQLALYFGANTAKFHKHKAKISYITSFLHGPVIEWLEPYIDKLSGEMISP